MRRDLLRTPDTATSRPPGENYENTPVQPFPFWQATRRALIFRPTVQISLYTMTPKCGPVTEKRANYSKLVELQFVYPWTRFGPQGCLHEQQLSSIDSKYQNVHIIAT